MIFLGGGGGGEGGCTTLTTLSLSCMWISVASPMAHLKGEVMPFGG